ncbi:MAG: alpha/beta hydrolase [Novosphingobium sp.]
MSVEHFHPELRRAARFIPRFSFTPRLARIANWLHGKRSVGQPPQVDGVEISDVMIPVDASGTSRRVRLYRPIAPGPHPAMLWIHGGGFIIGTPEQDEAQSIELCKQLGMVVAAISYRLAPQHSYPVPMEDCYAALDWLHANSDALQVDRDRIIVGGASAGAGLAAGLVLLAHDRAKIPVAYQLLIYPMLDDRTALRTDVDDKRLRLWTNKSNRFGWSAYLGQEPGGENVPEYAAPARRQDLGGLPPAWIGVGTSDLFHDEDVAYARRLQQAGVPCTLKIVEGAFHGFEIAGLDTPVVKDFRRDYFDALARAIEPTLERAQ